MLYEAITLDAGMTASSVLARLARNGLWLDPQQTEARAWLTVRASQLGLSFEDAALRLARDPRRFGVAIRRQWGANILWYSRQVTDALQACMVTAPHASLLDALSLHEPDSRPPLQVSTTGETPQQDGVVLDSGVPVAVSMIALAEAAPHRLGVPEVEIFRGATPSAPRSAGADAPAPQTTREIKAWPRLDAPTYVPAQVMFEVIVGLATVQQQGVAGGQVVIPLPTKESALDLTVDLVAHGLDAPDGWSRTLHVEAADPGAASVHFRLVGREPAGPQPVLLTTLEVRYVRAGVVCGLASRPLIIGHGTAPVLDAATNFGIPWLAQPATATAVDLQLEKQAPDLTIEISKPDRDASSGRFVCRLYSPHDIAFDAGPHNIDFLDDAKTFAKSIVESVRDCAAGDPLVENALDSIGDLVAEKLPAAAFDALRAVAQRLAPAPPALLIVSAESYVPWELARIVPPLDASRPPFLGAQALVGRWLRDASGAAPATGVANANLPPQRPAIQPPTNISVRHMAVMAGMYKSDSGLRKLPAAEAEASALVAAYDALPLAASTQALKQLLDAQLERGFDHIGGADAVHFAGHGDFDPTRPDSSVLFLSNGKPIPSLLFRSAKYGGAQQPLIFLNACMIGVGGQLLGEMGGFPGNCLRGGFGGVLGALWEVDDTVAAQIAIEFWRRAMPQPGKAPEPLAAILRDLRAGYTVGNAETPPQATYLSYVFFGHPRLTLS